MLKHPHWDTARVAVFVWIGLLLGFAVYGFLYPWSHSVYNVYALAARNWWQSHDMYATEGTAYYRYCPLFAVWFSPFAFLSDNWGNPLWRTVNLACFAAGLWAFGRAFLPGNATRSRLAALFLLVLPISLHSMYNAQANLTMVGAVLLALAAAKEEQWNRAAGWMAVATLIKGYPIALALVLMVVYARRFALPYVAALLVGLALPFATHWPSFVTAEYRSWFAHLLDSTSIMRERLRSLDYLFLVSGRPLSAHTLLLIQGLAGLGVLMLSLLLVRRATDQGRQLRLTYFLYTTWVVLCGPATEACTYVVIAPAITWALIDAFCRPNSRWTKVLLLTSLLLMGPCSTDMVGPTLRNFANEHGSQPIGALLFLCYVVISIVTASPNQDETSRAERAFQPGIAA